MTTRKTPDDFERSAAGMDYEDPVSDGATSIGHDTAGSGPEALFAEMENLLPEEWREQIRNFPVGAMILGFSVGLFLGMKKGDELIAAGTAFVTATAMANVNQVIGKATGGN